MAFYILDMAIYNEYILYFKINCTNHEGIVSYRLDIAEGISELVFLPNYNCRGSPSNSDVENIPPSPNKTLLKSTVFVIKAKLRARLPDSANNAKYLYICRFASKSITVYKIISNLCFAIFSC